LNRVAQKFAAADSCTSWRHFGGACDATYDFSQADGFRVELCGERVGGAPGLLVRDELQRFLQMLQAEVAKAGRLGPPAKPPVVTAEQTGPEPILH
jgi:hypothetical protein